MKPTVKEIIEKLNTLTVWCMKTKDDELEATEKRALAYTLAFTVELIRRKYDIVSGYYTTAEYAARMAYLEEYENRKE